jgi:type VI secretion system protein VasJ
MEISGEPYSPGDDGRTMIEAPMDHVKGALPTLLSAGSFADLLAAADECAANYPLWLDPHRYAAAALDGLGEGHEAAKRALVIEVGNLLLRAPNLPNMSFNDGTPFADDETKSWIQAEVTPVLGGGGGGGGAPARARSYVDKPVAEARGLLGNGQPADALAVLGKAAAAAPTAVDRFRTKLALAQICIELQQTAIARAQLEELEKIAEHHQLAAWQPELCAEVYAGLYTCYRTLNQGYEAAPEAREREQRALERLSQLDAGTAFKLLLG